MAEDSENKIRGSTEEEKLKRIFAKNLKLYMEDRGYSYRTLAKEVGVSHSAIASWLNEVHLPRAGMLQKLSEVLLCNKSDLIRENNNSVTVEASDSQNMSDQLKSLPVASQGVPFYDSVSCGKGTFVDEDIIDTLKLPEDWFSPGVEYFGNMASGDSMEPLILDGDYLVFEKSNAVPSGYVGAFSLNGNYYCKRLKEYNDGSIWLISDNQDYPPIPIKPEDDFRCLGVFSFKILRQH